MDRTSPASTTKGAANKIFIFNFTIQTDFSYQVYFFLKYTANAMLAGESLETVWEVQRGGMQVNQNDGMGIFSLINLLVLIFYVTKSC